eukprot:3673956-Rhodomonas_salina.1
MANCRVTHSHMSRHIPNMFTSRTCYGHVTHGHRSRHRPESLRLHTRFLLPPPLLRLSTLSASLLPSSAARTSSPNLTPSPEIKDKLSPCWYKVP